MIAQGHLLSEVCLFACSLDIGRSLACHRVCNIYILV